MSRIISKINGKLLALRSLWLSNGFASFGKTSRIAKGVTLVGGANICIGNKCSIGQYSALTVWTEESDKEYPELKIGDGVSIGAFNHITCTN